MAIIEIVKGSIVDQDVDCIVNAAHEALMSGGGVDGAIHRAAGPGLMRECMAIPYVEPGVRCLPGKAFLTKGGKLDCFVVHTVAPRFVGSCHTNALMQTIYKHAKEGGPEELASCYRSALKAIHERNQHSPCIKSVAFPSLGTGGHSYPIEEACPIAINTVLAELPKYPEIGLVRFVLFSDPDLKTYQEAYKKIAG